MADKKEKTKDVLVRDIPDELYNYMIDEQAKLLKKGERKSLGAILIELAQKGVNAFD